MLKITLIAVLALLAAPAARACDDAGYARQVKAQTRAVQDSARATRDLVRIERDRLKMEDRARRNAR
jgi:hypothetical protein